jgi:riboflavin biosynthesis pyrimidine reductase
MDANSNIPNVETIIIPIENEKFNIDLLNKELLSRNICQVLIEAGGSMNATMMNNKSVDEIYTFVCPRILMDNDAVNQFNCNQIQTMENATLLELVESKTIGEDVLLRHKVIH